MADPLVILHTESSTGWGGQENRTLDESIGLRSLGARVIVLCQPGSRLGERAAEPAVAVRSIPMRNNLDWQAVRSILRVIREEDVNTHTHPLCRVGQEIDEAKFREELRRSLEVIEGHLGTSCRYLCWPRGWFNDAAIRLAREEGYEACFSTIPGANGPRPDLGALRRIDVRRGGAAWLASVYLRLKGRGQHVPRQW